MRLGVFGGFRWALAWPSRGRRRIPSSITPTSRYAVRSRPRQFLYLGTVLSHHVNLKLCSCTQLGVLAYRALAGIFMLDLDSLNIHLLEVVHLNWTSWRADHVLVAWCWVAAAAQTTILLSDCLLFRGIPITVIRICLVGFSESTFYPDHLELQLGHKMLPCWCFEDWNHACT